MEMKNPMGLQGKGFFIWKIWDCVRGDPQGIAEAAKAARLTHVLIKVADRSYPHNIDSKTKADLVPPVAAALRARGIQVWGWHYVYGEDPLGEARIAIRRVQELGLDGYVIDAESEYKLPDRASAARRFMHELRKSLPDLPMALSSFRFPSYHQQLPWKEFLEHCDYNMPQVYWEKSHNPAAQMARCLREFQALNPYRPIIPTGPTYKWNGWRPTEEDLNEFLRTIHDQNLTAVNFFSWDECQRDHQNLWDLISKYSFGELPAQPLDLPQQYIAALNSHDPDAVAGLYQPDAVQVTAARTVQGPLALRAWYGRLITEQLPAATFSLTGSSGSGSSRHFTWRATSQRGSVNDGSDTLGVVNGKISYHYTSFTIQ
jgi:hypothetical protein